MVAAKESCRPFSMPGEAGYGELSSPWQKSGVLTLSVIAMGGPSFPYGCWKW